MTLNVDEMRSKALALRDLDAASVAEYLLVWNAYARSVNCVSVLELIDRLEQAEHELANQTSTVKTLAERNVELTKFKDTYSLQAQELEQAEQNAETYQTLYEQRAETLEQAEQAVERKQRALDTLARIIEMQQDAVILATDSQDLIGEDGDGDWDAVWDRVRELGEGKRNAEQAVARVRGLIPNDPDIQKMFWVHSDDLLRALDGDQA